MTASPPVSPLVRLVAVDDIPPAGLPLVISTTEPERTALAQRDDLVGLRSLTAELMLRHEPRGGVHVSGTVVAEVTQTCVVSLEPFDGAFREPVDVHFLPAHALEHDREARRRAAKAPPDEENEEDEPDLIEHGRIDVGALVAEHLTLGLDPYPRKPGAALDPTLLPQDLPASPFAVLRRPDEDRS